MARVYNFSAGPSMLPEKVLRQAQAELLEYGDSGQSVMEMSHRSKWFDAIIKDTEASLRRVMNIPDNYKVGFFQGGATQQFAMVPLNFMTTGKADYIVSGNFSGLAAKEAAKFGEAKIVASSKDKNFTYIPDVNAIDYDKDASYIHICQNNTIFGTQYVELPQVEGVPLVADLSSRLEEPLTVVSGLAFGIDAAAHSASLKNKVPTVGVLAHGLNTIYPAQHRSMAAEIIRSGGALVTEYPSSARIHKGNFLARNRIVAALADCVVVAESAERGGALVTARLASGYSRDVFALPGRSSDPYSAGCNRLIAADSAALITDASDLISRMMWNEKPQQPAQPALFRELTPAEQSVIDVLTELGEASLNRLATASGVSIGLLMSMLVDMEFRGLILSFPGGKYRLA